MGDHVAFMIAYKLRFGPTTPAGEVQIYSHWCRPSKAIRWQVVCNGCAFHSRSSRRGMKAAAKQAFRGMSWNELERICGKITDTRWIFPGRSLAWPR